MPIKRNQAFGVLAILTGVTFALLGIFDAPGAAFATVAVVVGALYAIGGMLWKETPSDPS